LLQTGRRNGALHRPSTVDDNVIGGVHVQVQVNVNVNVA